MHINNGATAQTAEVVVMFLKAVAEFNAVFKTGVDFFSDSQIDEQINGSINSCTVDVGEGINQLIQTGGLVAEQTA